MAVVGQYYWSKIARIGNEVFRVLKVFGDTGFVKVEWVESGEIAQFCFQHDTNIPVSSPNPTKEELQRGMDKVAMERGR